MLVLFLLGSLGFPQDDPTQKVEFIRLSYQANKEAFAFGSFHFEFLKGSSENMSDAQSGKFSKAVKADGLFVFDGHNARYELNIKPEDIGQVMRRDGRTTKFSALVCRMLTDGNTTLYDMPFLDRSDRLLIHHSAVIVPQATFFFRYANGMGGFPLNIGLRDSHRYDLFSDLSRLKNREISLEEFDIDARLGELKVCKLAISTKLGKRTYWIDLNRGSVPIRVLEQINNKGNDTNLFYSNYNFISNAGWIPLSSLLVVEDGALVERTVVTQIDTRNKPQSSAFQLDFPEPIRLEDKARKLAYSARKTWSLLNLPSRSSPGTRPAIPMSYIPPSELPGEIDSSFPWTIILPVGISFLLVFGSILILVRRRKRLQED